MAGFDADKLRETATQYQAGEGRPVPPDNMSFEEFLAWGDEDTWADPPLAGIEALAQLGVLPQEEQ